MPHLERVPHPRQFLRRHHKRGRQDSFEAPGQDPGAAVPHRRRRLAQEARRQGARGDRQVPPQGGARRFIEVISDRAQYWLGVGAQPSEAVEAILKITGDWQKFKGLPGTEGTLKVKEPKRSKLDIFNEALKEAPAEPKGAATTAKKKAEKVEKAEKPRPAAETAAEPAAAEAPAAEAPAAVPAPRPPRVPLTLPRPPRP